MRSLSITNIKGGVGKTTLIVNVAFYLQQHGWKIAIIDADEQANITNLFHQPDIYEKLHRHTSVNAKDFFTGKNPKIGSAVEGITVFPSTSDLVLIDIGNANGNTAQKFHDRMSLLEKAGYDICLTDLPGKFGPRFHALLSSVNYVIAPVLLDNYSIDAVGDMLETIMNNSQNNPDIEFLGLLPNEYESSQQDKVELLQKLRSGFSDMVLPFTIGKRKAIRMAAQNGTPLWLDKRTASRVAQREIKQLANLIIENIEKDNA